jgi:Na+/melibiose symporter-like transporter
LTVVGTSGRYFGASKKSEMVVVLCLLCVMALLLVYTLTKENHVTEVAMCGTPAFHERKMKLEMRRRRKRDQAERKRIPFLHKVLIKTWMIALDKENRVQPV